MEGFKAAARSFMSDPKFADFIIICDGKEYKVHRFLVSTHSKWFDRCCSRPFAEAGAQKVELKEDKPECVQRMIEFFYKFDYSGAQKAPTPDDALTPIELHAHMYALADKYEAVDLKKVARKKFIDVVGARIADNGQMLKAIDVVYNEVALPETDRGLRDIVVEAWIMGGAKRSEGFTVAQLRDYPDFTAEVQERLMKDIAPPDQRSFECSGCGRATMWHTENIKPNALGCTYCNNALKRPQAVKLQSQMRLALLFDDSSRV